MTAEEMERAVEFLLQSQARQDAQVTELREMVSETNRVVQMLATSQSEVNGMLAGAVADLTEAQRQTDARLNALIGVVERMVSGGGSPGA